MLNFVYCILIALVYTLIPHIASSTPQVQTRGVRKCL